MTFGLSTHWNASQHSSGEALADEMLELGFSQIELGYDLQADLLPGIRKRIEEGALRVCSVHNFCPVPVGAPYGHPELFTLASSERRIRDSAVLHTRGTIELAAGVGASVVIAHAGYVRMRNLTHKLIALCERGEQYGKRYEKIRTRLLLRRQSKTQRHLDGLCRSIEELMPVLEQNRVRLALENLPFWEAVPTEPEMVELVQRFDTGTLCYWHDIGHGEVRQHLGFVSVLHWLDKLRPVLAGMHIHDVVHPAQDHLMPPRGKVNFAAFKPFVEPAKVYVFEPCPGTPASDIREGLRFVQEIWKTRSATEPPSLTHT